jgi:hypothetical protein
VARSSSVKSATTLTTGPREIWIAFHRLEAAYGCAGDWGYEGRYLSHQPKYFDTKILGIFYNRSDANRCARNYANRIGIEREDYDEDDEEEDEDEEEDFVGEGRFLDAAEIGDTNTFSQRVYVERQIIR